MQDSARCWIAPVSSTDRETTLEWIRDLVCKRRMFGFSKHGKVKLRKEDKICFHATGVGIVADAIVDSDILLDDRAISAFYPWMVKLREVRCYIESPIFFNTALRENMDAFAGKEPGMNWTWFIKHVHSVTTRDFETLTKTSSNLSSD